MLKLQELIGEKSKEIDRSIDKIDREIGRAIARSKLVK